MFQETRTGERVEFVTRGPFDDSYAAEAIGQSECRWCLGARTGLRSVSFSLRRDVVDVEYRGPCEGSPERRYGRYATHLSSTLLQVSCSAPNTD